MRWQDGHGFLQLLSDAREVLQQVAGLCREHPQADGDLVTGPGVQRGGPGGARVEELRELGDVPGRGVGRPVGDVGDRLGDGGAVLRVDDVTRQLGEREPGERERRRRVPFGEEHSRRDRRGRSRMAASSVS